MRQKHKAMERTFRMAASCGKHRLLACSPRQPAETCEHNEIWDKNIAGKLPATTG